jgi:RNA polymerase sigma-70 factor (ECF subfamily)
VETPTDLLQRAKTGDREAFAELVGPYRGELHLLCYRMLGSFQDAEDALQEALLAAWLGLAGFEERSSLRTWLHRITTNRCINALRSARRQPQPTVGFSEPIPEPSAHSEVTWLQPYPEPLLERLPAGEPGPEARYESAEAISLAFLTALQLLPPNQRAVLLLRDVLGYRAAEVADLLGLTESAVTSALKRARATLDATARGPERPGPAPYSREERELTERFVAAFTSHDIEALLALMTDDVWVRMPPLPFEYHGIEDVRRFFTAIDVHRRAICRLVPTRANGQPAWGEYARDRVTDKLHCIGILVARFSGDRVDELTHFEAGVAAAFGMPRVMGDV